MFGRTVEIDGKNWLVLCTPDTPMSEVLRRAAEMAWREEDTLRRARPEYVAYRQAVDSI